MAEFTKDGIKDISLDDIIQWCQENNQIEWLKATASKTVERKIYPTITYTGKDGKEHTKMDKKAEPIKVEQAKISYVQIKFAFLKKFFPELTKEEKEPKESMWDRIAAL
jgi:hypothetical protein